MTIGHSAGTGREGIYDSGNPVGWDPGQVPSIIGTCWKAGVVVRGANAKSYNKLLRAGSARFVKWGYCFSNCLMASKFRWRRVK